MLISLNEISIHIALLKPQAYLDPGSGSLLLQIILGSLLAAGLVIKLSWKKLVAFVNRISGKQPAPDDDLE